MKNKKGQFYFLGVIILAGIFITLVTVSNSVHSPAQSSITSEGREINFEVSHFMDYLSNQKLSGQSVKPKIENFSNTWIEEFGSNKNAFFIFGVSPNVTIVGNKVQGENLSVNTGSGSSKVTSSGKFENSYSLSGSNVTLDLDGEKYNFTFMQGENLFYLIKYIYNNQTFVFRG